MGGHGGLNILPQKKWNVYNWDNRIKVMNHEKIVKDEIDEMKRKQTNKNLHDRIRAIKNKEETSVNLTKANLDKLDETKIFKEISQRNSIKNRIEKETYLQSLNSSSSTDECRNVERKDPGTNKTFKQSIKNHLNPWYCSAKFERPETKIKQKDREHSFLQQKTHRSKKEKSSIEELRKERMEREQAEKERIKQFLQTKT